MRKKIPVHPTPLSLAAEILSLMDALIARLGIVEYCKWLAATPAAWVLSAPYAEIHAGLTVKLADVREACAPGGQETG